MIDRNVRLPVRFPNGEARVISCEEFCRNPVVIWNGDPYQVVGVCEEIEQRHDFRDDFGKYSGTLGGLLRRGKVFGPRQYFAWITLTEEFAKRCDPRTLEAIEMPLEFVFDSCDGGTVLALSLHIDPALVPVPPGGEV